MIKNSLIGSIAVFAAMAITLGSGGTFAASAKASNTTNGSTSCFVSDKFRDSTQNFSIGLFKKAYKGGQDTLVSPTSACLCLGMVANGASGLTLKEFQNVLGKYDMTVADLNKAYKDYSAEMTKKSGSTKLTLSNSIWLNKGFKANNTFLKDNNSFFGAVVKTLDFADKNSANVINSWVKDKTGGKIDKIVDKLNSSDVMHLINALDFEAKWKYPFDLEDKPRSDSFTLDNGGSSKATFMWLESALKYVKTSNETSALLPYDDGRYAMLCILPNKGVKLSAYIKSMTDKTIPELDIKMTNAMVSLKFPQFKVNSDLKLNDTLKSMGLNTAFNGKTADFSKMCDNNKRGLFISTVHQKTFLQVDELGTKAGAVTDTGMCGACDPSQVKSLSFDRPFVYAVIDTKTSLPLFIGAMDKPASTLMPKK